MGFSSTTGNRPGSFPAALAARSAANVSFSPPMKSGRTSRWKFSQPSTQGAWLSTAFTRRSVAATCGKFQHVSRIDSRLKEVRTQRTFPPLQFLSMCRGLNRGWREYEPITAPPDSDLACINFTPALRVRDRVSQITTLLVGQDLVSWLACSGVRGPEAAVVVDQAGQVWDIYFVVRDRKGGWLG
jgi:hypothetical protein